MPGEGNSIRATVRMTGVAKNTIVKLLEDLGQACAEYQDGALTNLPCRRIECDEIWSFCYAKQKNVPEEHRGHLRLRGRVDADGSRRRHKTGPVVAGREQTVHDAWVFLSDLKSRLRYRVQLTTDGHEAYLTVVEPLFGSDGIDFAMLHKLYGNEGEEEQRRYSPAVCTGIDKRVICGHPDDRLISTSYVERQNLTMRRACGGSPA
jgi:hypothetical protein